jgi:hypothetical protein
VTVPCSWTIDVTCCAGWDDYSEAVQQAATSYATTVLWAATGRQFGLCPQTVRPCGRYNGNRQWIWGWGWSGGAWIPYMDASGVWRNCGCNCACDCQPRCQVWLPAPVDQILEVNLNDAIIDPTAYRVDNSQWLVRTDGDCWPECANVGVDSGEGFFEVSYVQGVEVPSDLRVAAGTLACEWAKACTGASCRLPGRAAQIARQGVSVNMVSLDNLMENGFTGLPEVDQLIQVYNPRHLPYPLRVVTPDISMPRMTTWP